MFFHKYGQTKEHLNIDAMKKNLSIARSKKTKFSNGAIKAKEEGREWISPQKGKPGKKGLRHTDESKEKQRKSALNSPHRRLVRSRREYITKEGLKVILDSSWEEILAKRLDELNVKWIRPTIPIRWIDSKNTSHNYFPDFYLENYDLYLDPKNPFAEKAQIEKISIITKLMKNLIIIRTEEECKNFNPSCCCS